MYELLIVLSNLGFLHISNTDRIFAMIAQNFSLATQIQLCRNL